MNKNTILTLEDSFKQIADLVDSYSIWDTIHGMLTFEFFPNKMVSCDIYIDNNGIFQKVSVLESGLTSDLLKISSNIRQSIEIDESIIDKPDQLLFNIYHDSNTFDYKFNHDVMTGDTHTFFHEMLYFEYHLTKQIPESDFIKESLNDALIHHNEPTI